MCAGFSLYPILFYSNMLIVCRACAYIDAVSLSTFDCDFENASCSLQWGSSGRPGVWSWTEQQGRTRSRGTGPEFDNTTRLVAGMYMMYMT